MTAPKSTRRRKADAATAARCNTFLLVLEHPGNPENVGAVLRCANACGVAKVYIVTPNDSPLARFVRTHPLGRYTKQQRKVTVDPSATKPATETKEMKMPVPLYPTSDEKIKMYAHNPKKSTVRTEKKTQDAHTRLKKAAASAERWTYVRTFATTEACLTHLAKNKWCSLVTLPHLSDKPNQELRRGDYTVYRKLAVWMGNEVHGVSDEAIASARGAIQIPMYGHVESLNLACATMLVASTICDQRRDFSAKTHVVSTSSSLSSDPLP